MKNPARESTMEPKKRRKKKWRKAAIFYPLAPRGNLGTWIPHPEPPSSPLSSVIYPWARASSVGIASPIQRSRLWVPIWYLLFPSSWIGEKGDLGQERFQSPHGEY
ncbi:hypothetical protein Taro_027013 [Colocasia esculenta]|uniref:Uncharacterized protein n=1 Tax=Colocasia esculenta TaxID=4460 RepID=A0A843VT25_COLES|nr:hypothetical protein [Colocasia esculenta]